MDRPRLGRARPTTTLPYISVALAVVAFGILAGVSGRGWSIDWPWVPSLGLRLSFALDGLAVMYGLLATGIGAVVFIYGIRYMPLHLAHERRPAADGRRFWPWMVLFMVSMIGLAASRDLVLLFVFFDLTAVASYFLIGFDRHRADSRGAALMALVVTGVSAVAILIGAVLLQAAYGTTSIPELFAVAQPGPVTTAAAALIAIGALAKSAQVPLHFWLPRAMAAPTPVSAYLHSAAMVAAGVLVLGRLHPLLAINQVVLDGLLVVGFASILIGGLLALAHDELKQILAHSTISQYGYVVVLYGIGGSAGAVAAALYVIAHAIAKCALFLTAGYVTEATGESRLSHVGGLARDMPVVAVASAVAAASLAALPLTLGFFKDELFFAAALTSNPAVQVLAVIAAALTFAYIGRFWFGIFGGRRRVAAGGVPRSLAAPILVLAAITLVGGVLVEPFAQLAEHAAAVTHGAAVVATPAYHLDARSSNAMALAAWLIGGLILASRGSREGVAGAAARFGDRFGPRRWYGAMLIGLDRLSSAVHDREVRDLRASLAAILVPTGVLAALGFLATPTEDAYAIGRIDVSDLPIIVLLALAVGAAVTAARDSGRLRPVLALSVLGFALAGVYAVVGAPDVALVAVVIETVLTIVFVAVFSRLPGTVVGDRSSVLLPPHRLRNAAAGVVAGGAAFAVIWSTLSRPPIGESDAAGYIRLTPEAHGGDVVTVILADFRGLDTMVEITVLAVAIIGVASLVRRRTAP
jgi:multicomponent Na+:H+ antiporter subunit A